MNYYLYQNNQVVQKFHTATDGIAGIEKLRGDWMINCNRVPPLKLCYNGFESVTIREYQAQASK